MAHASDLPQPERLSRSDEPVATLLGNGHLGCRRRAGLAAAIEFVKPGRGTVRAVFDWSEEQLRETRERTAKRDGFDSKRVVEAVDEHGDVDLLVIPQGMGSEHHPSETLFSERFTCVVWADSALARQPLSFEAYTAAGHVVMQPVSPSGYSFESWFVQRYGVSRRVDVQTYGFVAAAQLVLGTDRIATVHRRLALRMQRMLPIALLEPPFPMPEMQQSMQWHKFRSHDPAIVWLRDCFHEAVREMDAAAP